MKKLLLILLCGLLLCGCSRPVPPATLVPAPTQTQAARVTQPYDAEAVAFAQ